MQTNTVRRRNTLQTMMNVEGNEFVVDLLSSVEVVMIEEDTYEGLEYGARIAAEAEAAAVSAHQEPRTLEPRGVYC